LLLFETVTVAVHLEDVDVVGAGRDTFRNVQSARFPAGPWAAAALHQPPDLTIASIMRRRDLPLLWSAAACPWAAAKLAGQIWN
jgi:hypothetical protein